RRNRQFERQYDRPERVIPPEIWGLPTPDKSGAMRILVARAARAPGVGSLRCLRDYFRTGAAATRQAVEELVASGELLPVQVGDRPEPWWLWHEATVPRRIEAAVLVCPFDSLIFERTRLESLFGFFYRIEIYLPEPRRQHGYYVYPFLLGDEFVARVDLKAHRNRGTLEVKAAWLESAAAGRQPEVAAALTQELTRMAGWLGLAAVEVSGRGDLAAPVARLLP
ncbi:MAG: DNA glycosylase AlkZ-like family protein, partial [Propionibacteriaceae bacterium]